MRSTLMLILLATSLRAAEPVTWLTDYNVGRKEASEAGKAVCLVIGGEHCIFCRKLEATTLADPSVNALLKQSYVAIKVDGAREADLVRALRVQLYPTTVLAGADGSIHAILNGYVTPEQLRENLSKTLVTIADLDKKARDTTVAKTAPIAPPVPDVGLIELDKLKAATREADEKAAALHLALADALQKHGDTAGAAKALEKVVQLCPNTLKAEAAQIQLTKLKGPLVATPASMKK
ncbi:hypothetical protein BH11PLA2_BH11PLA2_17540 [soil metagenome]